MKDSTKILIRWVIVLPCAVVGGILATFPLHWILVFWIFPHDGSYFLDFIQFQNRVNVSEIELIFTPFVIAILYIWIGAEIAPKYKLITASVLSVLYVCMMIYIFFTAHGQAIFDIKTAGGLLGLCVGMLIVWFRSRKIDQNLILEVLD